MKAIKISCNKRARKNIMSKLFNFTSDGQAWQADGNRSEKWRYSPAEQLLQGRQLVSNAGLSAVPTHITQYLDETIGDYYLLLLGQDKAEEKLANIPAFNVFSAGTISPDAPEQGFTRLNEVNNQQHCCINILQSPDKPLVIIYGVDAKSNAKAKGDMLPCSHPSLRLDIAHNVSMQLIEIVVGNAMSNSAIELDLEKSASLHHYVLGDLSDEAIHIGTLNVACDAQAQYHHLSFWKNGRMIRRNCHVMLEQPESHVELHGIAMLDGETNLDNSTLLHHQSPDTTASENFRTILHGKSINNFQGKIIVAQDAQNTESFQMSRAMLISNDARANHKPELEIYADEVKCSHGSTIGAPDKNQLFYLQSRGFSYETALNIICRSFLEEQINQITDENIKQLFHCWIN